MSWIDKIGPDRAEGALRAEYEAAVKRAGRVYQILQIQSLNHRTLRASLELYQATMHAPSGLSRAERELLATVVSRANACHY